MSDSAKEICRHLDATLSEIAKNLDLKKQRAKARKVLRTAAGKVKKVAVRNLEGSPLDADMERLSKGVRAYVRKDLCGFSVTVYPGSKKLGVGYYKSIRKGKRTGRKTERSIPLAFWVENGTAERRRGPKALILKYSKRKKGYRFVRGGKREGAPTGSMPAYKSLERAEGRIHNVVPDIVKGFEEIAGHIIKTRHYD